MQGRRNRRIFPAEYRGAALVHPWTIIGFVIGISALGVTGGPNRTPGTWLGLGIGSLVAVLVCLALWRTLARRWPTPVTTAWALGGLTIACGLGSGLTTALIPRESFTVEPSTLTAPAMFFVWLCQTVVWFLLWILSGVLVSGQRSYRQARRELWVAAERIERLRQQSTNDTLNTLRSKTAAMATALRKYAGKLKKLKRDRGAATRNRFLAVVSDLRVKVVEPALVTLSDVRNGTPALTSRVAKSVRSSVVTVPRRWQGTYFSGLVGALLICVVAISVGASPDISQAGLLVQIPLVGLAFLVSVPAALLLFIAATLTPLLTGNDLDITSVLLVIVIVILALISFLHRANEVRQSRVLEGISLSTAREAIDVVRYRQELEETVRKLTSILHGRLQGTLIALGAQQFDKPVVPERVLADTALLLEQSASALKDTAIRADSSASTFASALEQILRLWQDVMTLSIEVTDTAESVLNADPVATAVTIDVLTEATTNAAKYSDGSAMDIAITSDGDSLHVVATSGKPLTPRPTLVGTRLGLDYLRNITSNLRLDTSGDRVRLIADIPART